MEPILQERTLISGMSKKLPSTPANILRGKEIHIMHEFQSDFYGHEMKAVVLGYIRPELDYTSRGDYLFQCTTLDLIIVLQRLS